MLIKTKFIPATNFHGTRISASDGKTKTIVSWKHELSAPENYENAVIEFIRRSDMTGLIEYIGDYRGDRIYKFTPDKKER